MLEDIAFGYCDLPNDVRILISYSVPIVCAIISMLLLSRKFSLRRSPYFVLVGITTIIGCATQTVWLLAIDASIGGYLWVIVLSAFIGLGGAGVLVGCLASLRSLDAYNSKKYAVLGLIPVANLILIFKPSEEHNPHHNIATARYINGWVGMAIGLCLFVAGIATSRSLNAEVRNLYKEGAHNAQYQAILLERSLQKDGVEKVLQLIASTFIPIKVDDTMSLSSLSVTGTRLERHFVVNSDDFILSDEIKSHHIVVLCTQPALKPLLRAGATINEIYLDKNKNLLDSISVSQNECDHQPGKGA